jgi:hypothetical protein
MSKYKCGMRRDPSVFDHDHPSFESWCDCNHPEYKGGDSPLADRNRPSGSAKPGTLTRVRPENEGKMYLGAPSNYDVDKAVAAREEVVTNLKAITSAETEEQKAERLAADEEARKQAKQVEREAYVRQLKAKRAPIQVEVAGLKEDRKMGRNGWALIVPALVICLAILGAAGVMTVIGGWLTGLIVTCYIVGGLGLLCSGAFSIYWFERFYGSNYGSEIKKREVQIEQLDNELAGYHDIVPDVFS